MLLRRARPLFERLRNGERTWGWDEQRGGHGWGAIYALGLVAMPSAEHVVPDEHLSARTGTGADADGRYVEGTGDVLAEEVREGFEHDGKGARVFEGQCGAHEGMGGCGGASLYAVAREGGGSLGEEADVRHDGDADLGECGDVWDEFLAALEFDGFGAAFLDDAHGCADGVVGAGCVGAKGHVGDEEGCCGAACDGAAVVEHLVEGETGGGGVAEGDLGEGVADEGDVDGVGGAGAGGGEVVGGEDGDGHFGGAELGDACDGRLSGRGQRDAHLAAGDGADREHAVVRVVGEDISGYVRDQSSSRPSRDLRHCFSRSHAQSTPTMDDHVSETDFGDDISVAENDENTPVHAEHAVEHIYAPVHRSSSLLARPPHDSVLRDITDQFFHPPSPSPVRISKRDRPAPNTVEPPRRPKKPRSLAYPADPPNWLYSRSSSSLPPSSPFAFPPSPPNVGHAATPRHVYLRTPSKASDSDPFGFVAVERAVKAKRPAPAPKPSTVRSPPVLPPAPSHAAPKPTRISAVRSPPRSTILPSAPSHPAPSFASFLDAPVPTNNEDIEGLYADEPVAGPSHAHVPAAPLLLMNSDQPLAEIGTMRSFPDPLRTPRKRKRRASPTPNGDLDSDDQGADVPSSPSPVKVSVGAGTHRRPGPARPSHTPVPKLTRAQTRAVGMAKPPTTQPARTKRVRTSYQHIPTPSSTPASVRPSQSSGRSTTPPTPVPPRRSTRQAAVGARVKLKGSSATSDREDEGRMKLRSRSTRADAETKTKPTRTKQPPSKSKAPAKTRKATATTTTTKPARGRPKGKSSAKNTKGKGKTRPLESVLDLSDDTREVRPTSDKTARRC